MVPCIHMQIFARHLFNFTTTVPLDHGMPVLKLHRECIPIFTEKENKIKLCLAFMRCVRSYNITRKFNPTSNCQKKT